MSLIAEDEEVSNIYTCGREPHELHDPFPVKADLDVPYDHPGRA